MIWAAGEVWRDLFNRRYPPYAVLKAGAEAFDAGDTQSALRRFQKAVVIASRHGDLAAVAAAWQGIARARAALGDTEGAEAASASAEDAERQLH